MNYEIKRTTRGFIVRPKGCLGYEEARFFRSSADARRWINQQEKRK